MTQRNSPALPVTDLHQAILDVVWKRGKVTADQVRTALEPRHRLTDSSVRTLLRRLEARGHLAHDVEGKVFVYRAAVAPSRMAARAVRQIIQRFWANSEEQFLLGMVDENVLSAETLERLAKRVKKAKK